MTTTRTCPRCTDPATALHALTDAGITIDHCPSCRGFWLDRDEWAPIVGWARSVRQPHSIPVGSTPPSCPACVAEGGDGPFPLAPRGIRHVDDVEIDICTSCGGAWLDGGELQALQAQLSQARRAEQAEENAPRELGPAATTRPRPSARARPGDVGQTWSGGDGLRFLGAIVDTWLTIFSLR
ncbi:MAG: zf-TFIIB domain-containing protein [Acidobacteriota bacterium]